MSPEVVVLLVQPERDDREMYAEFFRHQGWLPIPVPTAGDALRVAPIADVIIAGILLPGDMDGVEFIAQLKADERTKSIPVIVLTTCAWKSERARAENAGCDMFLAKPCLPDDLERGSAPCAGATSCAKAAARECTDRIHASVPSHIVKCGNEMPQYTVVTTEPPTRTLPLRCSACDG